MIRRATALAVLLVAVAGLALVGRPVPAAAAEPAARLVLTSITPTLVQQGDTVRVTGRISNTGDQPLDVVQVRLRGVSGRLGTRVDVDAWLDGRDAREGVPVEPVAALDAPLAPGSSAPFTVEVPASRLGLSGEFGAYPLAVDARATTPDGVRDQVAFLRTTVQWQPPTREYAQQQLGWLVPFAGLPGPTASAPSVADLAAQVAPGQRLSRLLEAASVPGVTWAVDPQLLQALQRAAASPATTSGETGTATSTSPSTASPTTTADGTDPQRVLIRQFLTAMRTAAAGRDVLELPFADPDLEPISEAGSMSLLPAARAAGAGTIAEVLGVTPRTDVAWPPDGYASDELVGDLSGQGVTQLVLDGASRPLVEALNYTPDARTTNLPAGATAVLSDPQLSSLAARVRSTDVAATSRFLAETAAATTERPGLARRLLVALPRTVNLDPTGFRGLVQTAGGAAWLQPIGLTDLLSARDDRGDASDLPRHAVRAPSTARTRGVTPSGVDLAVQLRGELSALGEVVAEPSQATAALQRSTLDLVSAVWRGHRSELAARQQQTRTAVDRAVTGVHVLPTTITFLRSSGELQLTIANDLQLPVRGVRLRVVAPSPRLVVQREVSDPVDLQPGTRASVRVPVRALASGQVDLQAQLVAPSGASIGNTESVQVRVRPTDSWVLTVGGAVVVVVLLVGLVRAVRRPRRRALTEDEA